MFFDKYYSLEEITGENIEEIAEKKGYTLNKPYITQSDEWLDYIMIKSAEYNFSSVEASCYAYYITTFLTGMGVSATAGEMFYKEKLLDCILDIYNSIIKQNTTELDQQRQLYNEITHLFTSEEIQKYEKQQFRKTIRVEPSLKKQINSYEGSTIGKIRKIIKGEIELQPIKNEQKTETITFSYTISDEKEFNNLPGDTFTDKFYKLIGGK